MGYGIRTREPGLIISLIQLKRAARECTSNLTSKPPGRLYYVRPKCFHLIRTSCSYILAGMLARVWIILKLL